MAISAGTSTLAGTIRRNSSYLLILGVVGILVGLLVIDSRSLIWAGATPFTIGVALLVASSIYLRYSRTRDGR